MTQSRRPLILGAATAVVLGAFVALGADEPAKSKAKRPTLPADWARRTKPVALWLGQDGHDVVGPSSGAGPSDVQDIHVAIAGLPKEAEIVSGSVDGLGGDQWLINGPYGPWKALLQRKPGATVADLYMEPPHAETGRPFAIKLNVKDGPQIIIDFAGGAADPDLRMPGAALSVQWLGQSGQDRVGRGPSVGPDGLQDVQLGLERLSKGVEVKAVTVEAGGGLTFESGANPRGHENSELVRRGDDPSRGDLFLQPAHDLTGRPLDVTVSYANGKTDRATLRARRIDPELKMPKVAAPKLDLLPLEARWVGQDGTDATGPGDVHVALGRLPRNRPIAAAALSDPVGHCWVVRLTDRVPFHVDSLHRPLSLKRSADGTKADLHFPPMRDETGSTLTLRLVFEDGRSALAQFPGGKADPARRVPGPGAGSMVARPGDDLQKLVKEAGTVRLSRGMYELKAPLILTKPVTLTGDAGATLRFTQPADGPTWTAAIKVHSGRTTLEGFAVRFGGPVRWTPGTSYGPAVIGTTDNHDQGFHDVKVGLVFRRLDLEGPPAAADWEEAPRLIRVATAHGGRIEKNTLRGGTTEFLYGPWTIADNDYRGTPPHTFCYGVFAGHSTTDLVLKNNRARPAEGSGKTWRFLVLTGSGAHDLIEGNLVSGIGPRDDDKVQENAPEIILTESYHLRFEGRPAAVSADRRVLAIRAPQGEPARTGDVVAVLSGPNATQWRRIAQAIDPQTYLLEAPLPHGDIPAVAIASGFVEEVFRANTVDARASRVAVDLFLAGNHYGTLVERNRLAGAGALRLVAAPTEHPVHWGWSHAPMFGLTVANNIIEDAPGGALLAVEHSPHIKSSRGRTYMVAAVNDTTIRWTEAFLAKQTGTKPPPGLLIGEPGGLDPAELFVGEKGTRAEGPASPRPEIRVARAMFNGEATEKKNRKIEPKK